MNETPENQKVLLALAKNMCAGAAWLQDTIGLHHHRDATLDAAILKLEGDPAATCANYYRLFLNIRGVDADLRFRKRASDLDRTFTNLTLGTTMSAYIIAANPGGESMPHPKVSKVVGV